MSRTIIESLGVYLPPQSVTSHAIVEGCRNLRDFPLERLTGIEARRMAGEVEFSIDLARRAVSSCLELSTHDAGGIELLICCNISRYDAPGFHFSFEPATSVRLRRDFGFVRALCFDISNACAGMFTGIHVADAFLRAGVVSNALVVSGEYITHLTRTAQHEISGPDDPRMACLTLGDSGAAVLLERRDDGGAAGFHCLDLLTLGRHADACIAKPTESEAGGAIMLTDSVRIHDLAIRASVELLVSTFERHRWPRGGFRGILMHQTARAAIGETARRLNDASGRDVVDRRQMINNLAERGNTATTSHFVGLWDHVMNGTFQPGDDVVFMIQASGITVGAALYTLDDLPNRLRSSARATNAGGNGPTVISPGHLCPTPPAAGQASVTHLPESRRNGRRIRIESLGSLPLDARHPRDAIELAARAADDCLRTSRYARSAIDVLIHAGVHRNEFVCEPAIAALVAGRLHMNDAPEPGSTHRTLAFDVFNGSMGTLNALSAGVAMISAEQCGNVMVIASEVENNAEPFPERCLGIEETGSSLILDTSEDASGFGSFLFRYDPANIAAFASHIGQVDGTNFLSFTRDERYEDFQLDCLVEATVAFLTAEALEPSDIAAVFPPQHSPRFTRRLSEAIGIPLEHFVDATGAQGRSLFTSSLPYALRHARETGGIRGGELGLLLATGSGVQAGCALYHF